MPNTKEVEQMNNPILTGYRETLLSSRDNAIENQEQENREDYHIGREDAFNYALEMLSKHEALSPLEQSENKEEWVILKSGAVYDNRLFDSLPEARNYVVMQNPKRKWKKSDNESELICALYGTKFIFQPLDYTQTK